MRERAHRARCDLQDYANQRYVASSLDDNYFEELISHCSIMYNDGLDAPNFMPAGAMANHGIWYDRLVIERGVDMVEQRRRDEIMRRIFAEIQLED